MARVITVTFPPDYNGYKVVIIRAIRCLTGLGLKAAKDVSEALGPQALIINTINPAGSAAEDYIIEQVNILKSYGCVIGPTAHDILDDLRELATMALQGHEDELANEILQLVLVEKLRRPPRPNDTI